MSLLFSLFSHLELDRAGMRPNEHVADHGSLSGGRGLGTKGDTLDVGIAAAKDNTIVAGVEARVLEVDVAATLEVDAVIVGPPRITEHFNAVDVDVAAAPEEHGPVGRIAQVEEHTVKCGSTAAAAFPSLRPLPSPRPLSSLLRSSSRLPPHPRLLLDGGRLFPQHE